MKPVCRPTAAAMLLALFAACAETPPGPESANQAAHPETPAGLEAAPTLPDSAVQETVEGVTTPNPPALEMVVAETALGRTGPGGVPFEVARRTARNASHLQRRTGSRTFAIALRTSGLVQYPCSSCHLPGARPTGDADAHQDIAPVHPAEAGAKCRNCHASSAVDRLLLASGETASLDQAYRLCAQCHASQAASWAGGAHGKRLDGWRGRRVVMNCADCHDPHQPAVQPRIPFPGPRLSPRHRASHE